MFKFWPPPATVPFEVLTHFPVQITSPLGCLLDMTPNSKLHISEPCLIVSAKQNKAKQKTNITHLLSNS